jgi:pimeloyl-ACP methyl ester carboxylesterase
MTAEVTWSESHDTEGMTTVEFIAKREGRRDVTGALWLPDVAKPDVPLLTLGHGASGDRYQNPLPELAQRFVKEVGCPALSMDGPVHGLRHVEPGGRAALRPELARPGAVEDMVNDWNFAIDLAMQHADVGTRELLYFGLSMGSMFGIPMLAQRDDVIASTLGLLGTEGMVSHLGPTFIAAAEKITHPVFWIMQLEDELFSRNGYLALFDALGSADKRLHANPGLHPDVPTEEVHFAFEFMKRHINESAPQPTTTGPIAS